MPLTAKQTGVVKGMLIGALVTLCIVFLGSYLNPFDFSNSLNAIDRLSVAIISSLIPAIFLGASIGRLAKHRFFTPEDIDGGGLSKGTEKANVLQSLLQNTLEQTLLATLVYFAWSIVMPGSWLSVVPLAALTFGLGRILFFRGYKNGAASRAIGFTLTFYPSMTMLIGVVGLLIWRSGS